MTTSLYNAWINGERKTVLLKDVPINTIGTFERLLKQKGVSVESKVKLELDDISFYSKSLSEVAA